MHPVVHLGLLQSVTHRRESMLSAELEGVCKYVVWQARRAREQRCRAARCCLLRLKNTRAVDEEESLYGLPRLFCLVEGRGALSSCV